MRQPHLDANNTITSDRTGNILNVIQDAGKPPVSDLYDGGREDPADKTGFWYLP